MISKNDASKIKDTVTNPAPATVSSVKIDKTNLSFGSMSLADLTPTTAVQATSGLTVSGVLAKGESLSVTANPWLTVDGTPAFMPTMQLNGEREDGTVISKSVVVNSDMQSLVTATDADKTFNLDLDKITMTNVSGVQPG
ncbi:hypothetical protein [Weissella confusa]|uniref:Uncharacterized protein n=1 Tax=Weissella confusa TaxID=1583 RepID=A0A4Z0RXT1_WEICO|nr:hypothetical protein [Weissella confusa]TGE74437.1 hypothetical protein C6P11_03060 [Weissella confusa]